MKIVSNHVIFFTSIMFFILISGCSDPVEYTDNTTEEDPNTYGQIRFIHSASSTSNIDVAYRDLVDKSFYTYTYDAVYGNQYGYSTFISGKREFRIYIPNTNTFIADCKFDLEEDQIYSLIAFDYEAALDTNIMVIRDTVTDVQNGFALLRMIHLCSDIDAVFIGEKDSTETLAELDHLERSAYMNLPARTYRFNVRSKASGEVLQNLEPVTLQSGLIYTGILSGSVSDLTPIELNMIFYIDTSIR
jgi:hypothetical protein